jgi:Ca2+-transporting ATPase
VKGAAPAVTGRSTTAWSPEASVPWDEALQKRADDAVNRMAGEGQRVMAAASRDLDPATFDADGDLLSYVTGLEMASLVAMVDPPRKASMAAVHDAQAAGIRVRMVTGDDVTTGAAIATQLGIPGEAMLGADFAALSDEERLARIDGIGVVGRVAPEHKVLLVETLRKRGEVVAMAGDGVNDAPALAAAEVGVAMGAGADVAIESAGVTLLHGDLQGIVAARRLSRAVMRNIRQNLVFAFAYNVAGVPIAAGALYPLFGWTLSPAIAAAAMALSSVSVVGNALRLRSVKLDKA